MPRPPATPTHRARARCAWRVTAAALVAAGAGNARAGGAGVPEAPRAVGRAGVGTVSDDGLGAVLTSPAALARRDARRATIGVVVVDDDLTHAPARDGAPAARAQDPAAVLPDAAAIAGLGPIVIGAALATDRAGRVFAAPEPQLSLDSVDQYFAYRYAGIAASVERRTFGLAAAARVTDWLAIGAGATLAQVRIGEHRRIWAGFTSRLLTPGDPAYDLDVEVDGTDRAVPGAVFGAFVAPAAVPIEAAASIAWSNQIHATGGVAGGPQVGANLALGLGGAPRARVDLPADTALRVGARWLAERWTVELGGEALIPRDTAPSVWRVADADVIDVPTGRRAPLVLASRLAPRRRFAGRIAVDVELIGGFLWLTGGYAWQSRGTDDGQLAPTTADLGGHTAAVGVELAAGGLTATLGWARTFGTTRTMTASSYGLDDPFDPVPTSTGLGRYAGTRDQIGVALELADE